jgi:hypothetical protein
MDDEFRVHAAKQGVGSIYLPTRCQVCNYLAISWSEKLALIQVASECPHCKTTGRKALIPLSNYALVGDWVGEYAISKNSRDYASAVVMSCALVESCLQQILEDYMDLHPDIKSRFEDDEKVRLKDVLGASLTQLLQPAPKHIKTFPSDWQVVRKKRNLFMHGKSSSFHINQADAYAAMDLIPKAIEMFAWLNNRYCLQSVSSAAHQPVAPR